MSSARFIRPTFLESDFDFCGPIPSHANKRPFEEMEEVGFSLSTVAPYSEGGHCMVLAVNVPTLTILDVLIAARMVRTIERAKRSGITEDLLVKDIDRNILSCVYEGRYAYGHQRVYDDVYGIPDY